MNETTLKQVRLSACWAQRTRQPTLDGWKVTKRANVVQHEGSLRREHGGRTPLTAPLPKRRSAADTETALYPVWWKTDTGLRRVVEWIPRHQIRESEEDSDERTNDSTPQQSVIEPSGKVRPLTRVRLRTQTGLRNMVPRSLRSV